MPCVNIRGFRIGEGRPKVILPIVERTEAAILEKAAQFSTLSADCVEWRVDWCEGFQSPAAIARCVQRLRVALRDKLLLVTFRTKAEGGEQALSHPEYLAFLRLILDTDCADLLDIEFFPNRKALPALIAQAHAAGIAVVCSSHDFEKTPPKEELVRRMTAMQQAGTHNPLLLLDEIDKVSADYKGDTSSALLEVLDSEQNNKFADHYVELPIDLSEVLFIATANDIQNIPRPLLDRMEVIEISSYTENEKFHIAKEHLVPKQKKANGLKEAQLVIEDEALMEVISGYTREAGVRSLERQIGRICRKSARKILEEQVKEVVVTKENLEEFLGKERYEFQPANEKPEIGIVRGLAWTAVGGDTLQIEVNVMPGKGEFLLTGQLGDVMKESAQAGISFIRSVAEQYEIPKEFFEKHDIHIHIPEGAVPKDGPSAGITMATAMVSAITKVPVKADVAMTGEITLRGRVLPIGGLKEKLLAAKKAGIHMVLVPEKNEPDVRELDAEITDGLQIEFVGSMEQVLKLALVEKK